MIIKQHKLLLKSPLNDNKHTPPYLTKRAQ